jgi:hypothetical protein
VVLYVIRFQPLNLPVTDRSCVAVDITTIVRGAGLHIAEFHEFLALGDLKVVPELH